MNPELAAAIAPHYDSAERRALLLIARDTSDAWARAVAVEVLAALVAEELEAGLAELIVQELAA